MAYGAVGDTIADDTTPVAAAFAAAAAVKGTVNLSNKRYLTTAPIVLSSSITVKGCAIGYNSQGKGGITNNTGDVFQFGAGGTSGVIYCLTFENVTIRAGAGHIFNMGPAGALAYSNFKGCSFEQNGTAYSIFYCPTNANYISNFVGANTYLYMNPAATVPAIYLVCHGNNIGTNIWQNCVFQSNHSTTVPFVHIESAASSSYSNSNIFRDIDCEELDAGVISLLGCTYSVIENVNCYDTTTFTGVLFNIGAGSGGAQSFQNTIRNSGSIGGGFAAGAYHVKAAPTTGGLLLDTVGGESGTSVLSVRSSTTTIINSNAAGVTSPSLSVSGVGNATAGMRLVGGMASGPPTTGTFLALDVSADQTGSLWVCTSGGINSAATWAEVGSASGYASASDPLNLGKAQTFLPGIGNNTYTIGANVGYFMKLMSGGFSISHVGIAINVSSGNICVAAYKNSGSGVSSVPSTQYQTSGSVPCPAQGTSYIALGGSCTPDLGDWLAVGSDNVTVSAFAQNAPYTGNYYLARGSNYQATSLTGAVLPSPAGTITASGVRMFFLEGS